MKILTNENQLVKNELGICLLHGKSCRSTFNLACKQMKDVLGHSTAKACQLLQTRINLRSSRGFLIECT